jgi:hypothetical protein
VAQMWIWFVVGAVYVIIAIFTFRSAKRLRRIDTSLLRRYSIRYSDEVIEQLNEQNLQELDEQDLQAFMEKHSTLKMGEPLGWEDFQIMLQLFKDMLNSLENFSDEFNKATEVNRGVLYAAAVSFVVAAISFAQGLSLI